MNGERSKRKLQQQQPQQERTASSLSSSSYFLIVGVTSLIIITIGLFKNYIDPILQSTLHVYSQQWSSTATVNVTAITSPATSSMSSSLSLIGGEGESITGSGPLLTKSNNENNNNNNNGLSSSSSSSQLQQHDNDKYIHDAVKNILQLYDTYKEQHSSMTLYNEWLEVEEILNRTTKEYDDGGNMNISFNLSYELLNSKLIQRKYSVVFYSCPYQAGNRIHHFLNGIIWSIITNRTLLYRYYDRPTCNIIGHDHGSRYVKMQIMKQIVHQIYFNVINGYHHQNMLYQY